MIRLLSLPLIMTLKPFSPPTFWTKLAPKFQWVKSKALQNLNMQLMKLIPKKENNLLILISIVLILTLDILAIPLIISVYIVLSIVKFSAKKPLSTQRDMMGDIFLSFSSILKCCALTYFQGYIFSNNGYFQRF